MSKGRPDKERKVIGFSSSGQTFELQEAWLTVVGGGGRSALTADMPTRTVYSAATQGRETLRRILRDCPSHHLRSILRSSEYFVWRMNDLQVLDRIVDEVCRQRLTLLAGAELETLLSHAPDAIAVPVEASAADAQPVRATSAHIARRLPIPAMAAALHVAPKSVEPVHWISIELLAEDGFPIAGERYEIVLPDGATVRGTLDGDGRALVADIAKPGRCRVSFPRFDKAFWARSAAA